MNKKPESAENLASDEQIVNSEKPKQELHQITSEEIKNAKSIDELLDIVEKSKGNIISGTQEDFDKEKLKMIIEMVRDGDLGFEYLTRSSDLRNTVMNIMSNSNEDVSDSVTEPVGPIPPERIKPMTPPPSPGEELASFLSNAYPDTWPGQKIKTPQPSEEQLEEEIREIERQEKIKNDPATEILRDRDYRGDVEVKYNISVVKDKSNNFESYPMSFDNFEDLLDFIKKNSQLEFVTRKTVDGHEYLAVDTELGESIQKWADEKGEDISNIVEMVDYSNAQIWVGDQSKWEGEHYGNYYVEYLERDPGYYEHVYNSVSGMTDDIDKFEVEIEEKGGKMNFLQRMFKTTIWKLKNQYRIAVEKKISYLTDLKLKDILNGRISSEEKEKYNGIKQFDLIEKVKEEIKFELSQLHHLYSGIIKELTK